VWNGYEVTETRPRFGGIEEFAEYAFQAGWTDGLPVLPPEARDVDSALDTVDADPVTVLWADGEARLTVADVAVASVLAGSKASYFPVVLAAAEAYLDGLSNGGYGPSLVEASHCVVVNGPVRNQIGINCGLGLYGPGWRANATVGRALSFVVRATLGDLVPSFGDPGQFTMCFGEDEENSGWTPLHAVRGFDAAASAATVHSVIARSLAHDRQSTTSKDLLNQLVLYARGKVSGSSWFEDDPCSLLLIFPPESARVLSGWSKENVHEYLFERLVVDDGTPIQPVRLPSPEDLLIVAAGGPAFAGVQLLLSHRFSPVTRQVHEL
jgi:hypothetical protein